MKWHTPSTIFTILYLFCTLLSLDRVVVEARVLLGYPLDIYTALSVRQSL